MSVPQYLAKPKGYAAYPAPYVPWNGALISESPARVLSGAQQEYIVGAVPAALSTFILHAPNDKVYTFQFLYPASVQTLGVGIFLPLGAGSTNAQVTTEIVNTLRALPYRDVNGNVINPDFGTGQGASNHFTISWTIPGLTQLATGTQVGITAGAVSQQQYTIGDSVPGKVGKSGALLRG